MSYEIDYLPVGEGDKGGDAITFRYGDFTNPRNQYVVVIDGGTKDSGAALVKHITGHYKTDYVDLVVATHLHQDHTSGLTEVFDNLKIGKLAMHLPWHHTDKSKTHKSVANISELFDLATRKGIDIIQPFQGESLLDGALTVLGPSKQYYKEMVKAEDSFVRSVKREVVKWLEEHLDDPNTETLSDDYEDTSPINNTSLVLFLNYADRRHLFTGDAGKGALYKVLEYSTTAGINLSNIDFIDMPHHGSKRNVGPTIIKLIRPTTAFISCPNDGDPKHPSRKVINSLIRNGAKVYTTKGKALGHNIIQREGWGPATPESFFPQVED